MIAGQSSKSVQRTLTCSHCVSSVTEELSKIDGVQSVKVALNAGAVSRVMVATDGPVDTETIRAAVAEAGYELVDSVS